jgi:hypothetical protein
MAGEKTGGGRLGGGLACLCKGTLDLPQREWHQRPGTGGILCWNFDLHSFTHWSRTRVEIGANPMTVGELIHYRLATPQLITRDLAVS